MQSKLFTIVISAILCLSVSGGALAGSVNLLNRLEYDAAERDQANCGNCWVWASTGVMEIARTEQNAGKERLSIQFLDSCKTDAFACNGGNPASYATWYANKGFAVPWSNSNAAFQDQNGGTQAAVSCNSIQQVPNHPIGSIQVTQIATHNVGQSAAIANIKNVLNRNKAVLIGFRLPNDNFWRGNNGFITWFSNNTENSIWNPDFTCGSAYDLNNGAGGHAVVIVGYNDDSPDPALHYWIVLNSWGIAHGNRPNGLYLLAMNVNYDCAYPYNLQPVPALDFFDFSYTFPGGTACTYLISPTSQSFGSGSGSGGVNVSTQSGCSWTVNGNPGWVTINSGSSGAGSGVVSYAVSANTNTQARQAEFSIAGKTVTLTQEGSSTFPSNILLNGDFENGSQYWNESSSGGYSIITSYDLYANSGSWFAWLADYDGASESIYQDVTIPSGATSASVDFYYLIGTNEVTATQAYDKMEVRIARPSDNTVLKSLVTLSNLNAASDWARTGKLDISAFAGQTVRLVFAATTDASLPTAFLVDDVKVSVSFPAKANLTPYQPPGWSDKMVVSNTAGSHADSNPLYATDSIYLNWAVVNNGSVATSAGFSVALYIDSVLARSWAASQLSSNNYVQNLTDYSIGSLASGLHTIKLVADSSNSITESNESDNQYTKTISVLASSSAPGAPTNVSAVAGNAQATVSFTAPADGGSAITGYTVTSRPAGGVDMNRGTTLTSHTVTGLSNGTAYTFTVTATNSAGTGSASAESNSVTPSVQAPVAAFSARPSSTAAVPFTVNFTDQSQRATSWSWDFGDGTTSTEQNPSHSFPARGTYTVTLTAMNSTGRSTLSKNVPDFVNITNIIMMILNN